MKKFFFILFSLYCSNAWAVTDVYVDTDCATPGNGSSGTCSGANAPYSDGASALTAKAGSLTDNLRFLAAGTVADTSNPEVTGYTRNGNTITYTCDPNKASGCNYTGKWSTSHYRIVNTGGNVASFLSREGDITIDRIQIDNTGNAGACRKGIYVFGNANSGSTVTITNNIVRATGTGGNSSDYACSGGIIVMGGSNGWTTTKISNNIVYDFLDNCIDVQTGDTANRKTYIYYNTTVGCGRHCIYYLGQGSNDEFRAKNNIMQSCTGDDWFTDWSITTEEYVDNITSDATSPNTTGCNTNCRSKTVTFAGAGDYHLASSDTEALGYGADLSADSYYVVTKDIDNETRSTTSPNPDIGADEYSSTTTTTTSSTTTTTVASTPTPTPTPTPAPVTPCGVNTTRTGSFLTPDKWCDSPDKDADGYSGDSGHVGPLYVDGVDCDDENFMIYPGVSVGCDAGFGANTGWKTCPYGNTDGLYTSCVYSALTPLCEATGSGRCYYIDHNNGSDANDGTWTHPLKTLMSVSNCASGACAGMPAGGDPSLGLHPLNAGDVVYVLNGTYNETYSDNEGGAVTRLFYVYNRPSASNMPIVIKNYPGHTPSVVCTSSNNTIGMKFHETKYAKIQGFEVSGCNVGISPYFSSGPPGLIEVSNCYSHDNSGPSSNNTAGIGGNVDSYYYIHHNELYDNYDTRAPGQPGANHRWGNNLCLYGAYVTANYNHSGYTGYHVDTDHSWGGIEFKDQRSYGVTDSSATAIGNITWNTNRGIESGFRKTTISNNFIFQSNDGIKLYNIGGYWPFEHVSVTRNTVIATYSGYSVGATEMSSGPTDLTHAGNIYLKLGSSWWDGAAFTRLMTYGTVQQCTDLSTAYTLFDNNCYYDDDNTQYRWAWGEIYCSAPNYAISSTLADWQNKTPWDTNSYVENPALNTYDEATSTNCSDKGWRIAADYPEGTVSTTTTTTTTSTTMLSSSSSSSSVASSSSSSVASSSSTGTLAVPLTIPSVAPSRSFTVKRRH